MCVHSCACVSLQLDVSVCDCVTQRGFQACVLKCVIELLCVCVCVFDQDTVDSLEPLLRFYMTFVALKWSMCVCAGTFVCVCVCMDVCVCVCTQVCVNA